MQHLAVENILGFDVRCKRVCLPYDLGLGIWLSLTLAYHQDKSNKAVTQFLGALLACLAAGE